MQNERLAAVLVCLLMFVTAAASAQTILQNFWDPPRNPRGGFVASGNLLWGTTGAGGHNGTGTIFSVDPASPYLYPRVRLDLSDYFGSNPLGALVALNGVLYGTTQYGGNFGCGSVIAYDPNYVYSPPYSGPLSKVVSFDCSKGRPAAGLMASGSFLYGTTSDYGPSGSVFKLDTATGTLTTLATFTGANGSQPSAALVAYDSFLYGTTSAGGSFNKGTIFKIDQNTGTLTTIVNFDGWNGATPDSALVVSGSFLYGTTYGGGAYYNTGTVFKLAPASGALTTVVNFDRTNGTGPEAGLAASGSLLYGTTSAGGTYGAGTLFELDPTTDLLTRVIQFSTVPSRSPDSALVQYGSSLYGMCSGSNRSGSSGGGSMFHYDLVSRSLATDGSFFGGPPFQVSGPLFSNGSLFYGTGRSGGVNGQGGVFRFDASLGDTNSAREFSSFFYGTSGTGPASGLIPSGGFLYGSTISGGANGYNCGTIFKMDPALIVSYSTTGFTRVASMTTTCGPEGPLLDVGGLLYGTTRFNAAPYSGYGSVFRVDPATGTVTRLAYFSGTDGQNPNTGLVASGAFLYGSAPQGGAYNAGTIFKVDPATGSLTSVLSFGNVASVAGCSPGALTANGSFLYGATSGCGPYNNGTVFRFDPTTGVRSTLFDFQNSSTSGSRPTGALLVVGSYLYGTTSYGGSSWNDGTVFKIDLTTGAFTTLFPFTDYPSTVGGRAVSLEGVHPDGFLVPCGAYVCGTTTAGGQGGGGVVFSTNVLPSMTMGSALTRTAGTAPSPDTIATVNDAEDAAGALTVTLNYAPAGMTASVTKPDATGGVRATIGADCTATVGANSLNFKVIDSGFGVVTGNITVNVNSNPAPIAGSYAATTVYANQTYTVTPSPRPSDNGTVTCTASSPTFTGSFSCAPTGNSAGDVTIFNPNAGTHTVTVTTTDNCNASATTSFTLTVLEGFNSGPQGFSATATSPSQVFLQWNAVASATQYEIWRNGANVGTTSGTTYTDGPLSANTTFLYRVNAIANGLSAFSALDAATTVMFTNDPVTTATPVKAVHLTELRTAVNAMRAAAGLSPGTFTDNPLSAGTLIKAAHVAELRSALDAARATLVLPPANYTDSSIAARTTRIKAAHVQDLRNGVK